MAGRLSDYQRRLPRPRRPRGWQDWGAVAALVALLVLAFEKVGGEPDNSPAELAVDAGVRVSSGGFSDGFSVPPGDRMQYVVSVINTGGKPAHQVTLRASLPPEGFTPIRGSCRFRSSSRPDPQRCEDNFTNGGLSFTMIAGGSWIYVYFRAQLDPELEAGTTLNTVGVANSLETPEEHDTVQVAISPTAG